MQPCLASPHIGIVRHSLPHPATPPKPQRRTPGRAHTYPPLPTRHSASLSVQLFCGPPWRQRYGALPHGGAVLPRSLRVLKSRVLVTVHRRAKLRFLSILCPVQPAAVQFSFWSVPFLCNWSRGPEEGREGQDQEEEEGDEEGPRRDAQTPSGVTVTASVALK